VGEVYRLTGYGSSVLDSREISIQTSEYRRQEHTFRGLDSQAAGVPER